jgi:hypothetical protein
LQFHDVLLVRRAGAAAASESLAEMGCTGLEGLNKKNWYLLISNHHSWADIVVLCVLFRKHIPMNKYFLKQQLAWVPLLGWPAGRWICLLCAAIRAAIYSSSRAPR